MAGGGSAGHGASAGETKLPPLTPGPYRKRLGFVALIATFGGLLFGYDTSVINGAGGFMARPDQLDLSPLGLGIAASSLVYAAVVGAFTGGRISDAWGRRKSIAVMAIMFIVGVGIVVVAPNLTFVVVGRVLLGLAVGAAAVVVPVFLAELAPYEIRGSLAGPNEMMIVTGASSSPGSGAPCSRSRQSPRSCFSSAWRGCRSRRAGSSTRAVMMKHSRSSTACAPRVAPSLSSRTSSTLGK